jgi:hypothetical protein
MVFEVGKFYVHVSGNYLAVLCKAETTLWGKTMIGEEAGRNGHRLIAVGGDEDNTVGYTECSKEEWMKNFS